MNIVNTYTQGGQITLHNLRMLKQVTRVTMMYCLLAGLALTSFETFLQTNRLQWYYTQMHYIAKFQSSSETFKNSKEVWNIELPNNQFTKTTPFEYLRTPYFNSQVRYLENRVINNSLHGLGLTAFLFLLTTFFWVWRGNSRKEKEVLKGGILVKEDALNKAISKKDGYSKIKLSNVTLPKNFEVKHTRLVLEKPIAFMNSCPR